MMTDTFEFTLDEESEKKLYDILTDINTEKAPSFTITDKYGNTAEYEKVVHGRWTRENNYGIWKCSECGCKVNRVNPLKGNIWNYYYCPNCGADMRGEQDG